MYIQKKKHCDRQQYQFLGHLHFGQRTNKVVHFRKLEHEETIKTEKKSLTPQLWRKSSHTGSWVLVVRRWWASWDTDHAWSLRLLSCTSMLVIQVVLKNETHCSPPLPPPQTDPPHLPTMKVAFVGEGDGADRPDEGVIHLQAVQLGYCCCFIISVTRLYS